MNVKNIDNVKTKINEKNNQTKPQISHVPSLTPPKKIKGQNVINVNNNNNNNNINNKNKDLKKQRVTWQSAQSWFFKYTKND